MRTRVTVSLVTVCALIGCLAGPLGAVRAASAPNPLDDCSKQGQLTHTYSPAELRHALATMPADVKEYTDCYDVINRALLAAVGGVHDNGGGGSGGSFLPTPVIVVLIVLLLAAATLGALALRRRRQGGDAPPTP